jgi:hypothetical protein
MSLATASIAAALQPASINARQMLLEPLHNAIENHCRFGHCIATDIGLRGGKIATAFLD